jgi:arylsulfatase B
MLAISLTICNHHGCNTQGVSQSSGRWVRLLYVFLAMVSAIGCAPVQPAKQSSVPSAQTSALGMPPPPNIVVILVDDLGWRDVSFNGGDIATPNIDRIAQEGVRLERFYVTPVCSPTRAGLLTGRHPIRYGMMRGVIMGHGHHNFGLDPAATLMPQVLADAGYEQRGIIGKWHLGMAREHRPMQRGFTHFVGTLGWGADYFTHERYGEVDWFHDEVTVDEPGYATDLISDHATRFIAQHANNDEPFFLYVPYNAPHSPFQAKEEDLPRYTQLEPVPVEAVVGPGVPPERYEWFGGHAMSRARLEDTEGNLRNRQILGAMIHSMDAGIGRILDALDEQGIADNTIVWFFSDNGGHVGIGENRPFRGSKGNVFEGGIRVPAAVRWPTGGVQGGGSISAPLNYLDVMPTLMTAANIAERDDLRLDGQNVLPILRGEAATDREFYSYVGQLSNEREQLMAMDRDWKLIIIGPEPLDRAALASSQTLLFDLGEDPSEQQDVASEHPRIVTRLTQQALAFRALQPEEHVPLFTRPSPGDFIPPRWVKE